MQPFLSSQMFHFMQLYLKLILIDPLNEGKLFHLLSLKKYEFACSTTSTNRHSECEATF